MRLVVQLKKLRYILLNYGGDHMDLSRSLLKDFAKITNDSSERSSNNAYVRGSVKTIGDKKYVKVDGSEGLTPISEVVDVDDGDRVLVAIENHVATILGNFTFPPSARKEEEALNKAEDANNNANNAHNKAEDANNKADEAIKDATNASSKAEEAKKDAQAAINASNEVKQNVEDAKQMAQDANSKSDIAIEESGKAQNAVAGANEEINRINGEVTTVKGDISNAITELEKQANEIQATKEEMKLNYTSKTETSEVEASLKTEISKKVGELQSTVEQTYAGKNEVVEIEGKLQSQITQNTEGIKSTVSKTEKLEADTKEAQNRVDQALSSAFDAQAAADQALEYARKSQEAADLATQNAEIAQNKATSAQQKADEARELANSADRKLAEARTALAEAKQNLQDIINGGGTEDEIAAAEEKVRQAEIVVEQALADATEAEQMAKKAQDAADTAKADAVEAQNVAKDATDKAINAKAVSDKAMQAAKEAQEKVAALTKRITTAETAINQNSEAIELSAKKTEEIGNKLDNLQIGGRNILLDSRDGIICANSDFVDTTTPGEIITTKATGEGNAHSIITDKYSIPVVDLAKKVGTSYAFSIDVKITGSFTGLYFGVDFRTKDGTGNCFENWIRPESITADQWFRFSQVDAIKEDQNGITDSLFCFHWIDSTSGSTIEYKNLKLEEGNKATDWSPAPEDVLDGLDEVKDDLKNNYYNKTETKAQIDLSADAITQSVSKTYTTKDEFNNLNIGGRNWLKDSGQEVVSSEHKIHTYTPSSPLVSGDEYTLSICITPASGVNRIEAYLSNGTASIANIDCKGVVKQILHKTFVAKYESGKDPSANQSNADVSIYRFPNDSSVTGSSTIHWIKIEKGNKATDWSPAPEDVNGAIRSDSPPDDKTKLWLDTSTNPNLLKQWDGHDWIVINDPTEEIQYLRKELLSSITETSDKIKMEVSEKYYEKGETDTKVSEMGTRLEQTKNDFNFIFEEFQQSLNDLSNSTNSEIQKISKYIRFIDGNIVLGQVGNELTLKIQHDRISFIQNNIEVAYFSNRKLYVTDGEYTNSLTLGNFAFTPRANGNLSFRKVR